MRGGSLPKVGRFLKSFLSYDALLNLSLPFLGVQYLEVRGLIWSALLVLISWIASPDGAQNEDPLREKGRTKEEIENLKKPHHQLEYYYCVT